MIESTSSLLKITRFCIGFSIFFTILSSSLFSNEPDKKLHTECIYPTVMLAQVIDKRLGTGTGVIVRSSKIEDNKYHNVVVGTAHGLKGDKIAIKVTSYKNWSEIYKTTIYPGMIHYINPPVDLAVMFFVSSTKMPTASFSSKQLFIGDEVQRVGCGLGDKPRLEEGIVTSVNIPGPRRNRIHRISMYTLPGDSGGPLFEDYKIIGWTQSIRRSTQETFYNITFIIRIRDFYSMIKNESGTLDFVVDSAEPLPILPFFKLKTEFLNQTQRAIPAHAWLDSGRR